MAVSQPQPRVREGDRIGTTPDGMIGRILGDRYRVLSRLGEGGMGTVYLCEHVVLRRRFALKVLRPELADDAELVERFRNEAIAASRIGQENVVDVVDFGAEEDGALYYVMEALEGRSVGAILRSEGPFPVARTLGLLEQTCRALAAAHARGVVHRDVKPENVFVVRRDDVERVKILDFGISHVPTHMTGSRVTRAGSIIGTPEYMAPEQANGEVVDHRADVYALGVLAFEMLTNELPFEANGPVAMAVMHRHDTPDAPSVRTRDVPPEVDRIVLRALAKRPEDRFASMLELAAEIARVRNGLYGGGSTPNPGRASRPTMRYEPVRRSGGRPQKTLAVGEPIPEDDPRPTAPRGLSRVTRPAWVAVGVLAATVALVGGLWLLRPETPPAPASASQGAAEPAPRAAAMEPVPAAPVAEEQAPVLTAPVELGAGEPPAIRPAPPPASPAAKPAPSRPAQARQARPKPDPDEPTADPYADDLKPDPFR